MIKSSFAISLITLMAGFLLLGCQKNEPEKTTPEKISRDVLNIGLTLEPDHLDPSAGAAGAIDDVTYHNLFEGLTRINENGRVLPLLAHSWNISDDGKIYNFFLKENVRFHNGVLFNADHVLFTLQRAMADDSINAQKILFSNIASISKQTDHHVRITLTSADSNFPYKLAWGDAVMMEPSSIANNKQYPIGTGAFKFAEWKKGQSITLKRNDAYHADAPALATVVFSFFPDQTAAFNAIASKFVDGFPNFQAAEQLSRLEADKDLQIILGSTEGEVILATNHQNPFLADKNMRLAIAHALNRQAIIDGAMFGYATPIYSHIPPHHPFYQDLSHLTPFNLALAREFLAKTSYQGEMLYLDLPPPAYARNAGEIIANQLQQVGINISLRTVEWSEWLSRIFKAKNYDLTIIGHTEPNDMNIYARDDYYFSYNDLHFQQIMQDIQASTDPAQLEALYIAAQTILAEDAVNGFLFQLPKLGVWHKDLQGFWQNSPLQAVDVTNVSWK